jgi:DNA repair protein RecO
MGKLRSIVTQGLVLKRVSTGEADRVVTLLTPDQGKLVCVAKGARKLTSTKRGALEPGNVVKVLLLPTNSLALLTQATLISDLGDCWKDLNQLRRVSQILEIFDRLMQENQADPEMYLACVHLLKKIIAKTASDEFVRDQLDEIIQALGYPGIADTKHTTMNQYVSELAERELHSFAFLKVI